MKIRKYQPSDFSTFSKWWNARFHEAQPTSDMIPETYWVCEEDGKPIASFGFITTNLKKVCYSCHLVSDPFSDKNTRREALSSLLDFVVQEARKLGYQNLLAFSYQPKLTERFKKLGFKQTLHGLNSFCLPLENVCR